MVCAYRLANIPRAYKFSYYYYYCHYGDYYYYSQL